jgi:hypothetical protein
MKRLTLRKQISDAELNLLEKLIKESLTTNFREFIKEFAGQGTDECIFKDKYNQVWIITNFNNYSDIYNLTEEFINAGYGNMIPFGYDPGGWHFCLCMDKKDLNSIYINRWTDHLPKDQFLRISDSFEEFIDGLQKEN